MTVSELLNRISSRELAEWQAYDQIDPIGEARADLRAGIVASTVANVNRDPKKRTRPYKPADFMPDFDKAEREPDWQRMLQQAMMINAAYGGKDMRPQ